MTKKGTKSSEEGSRSRVWFIVAPNPRENGVAGMLPDDMIDKTDQEICDYVVSEWATKTKPAACLYCVSAKGLEHLHIVLCSANAVYFSRVKNFIGGKAHVEMALGSKADIESYINKTGKFADKGETIKAKAQIGELQDNQGARADVERIREGIDDGLSWQAVVRLDDRFFDSRKTAMIKNMFFDKRKQETPYKRQIAVHWICGEENSGKTGITLDLNNTLGEEGFFLVSDYKDDWEQYSGEDILVMDEFRGQLPYHTLLGMLDGYKKYFHARYANILGLWTKVYITTVKTPEETYSKMVSDEEAGQDPIGQLLSRITDFTYCYRVNRADGTKTDRNGNPCEFYKFTIDGEFYRKLKDDFVRGTKMEQIKNAARIHYEIHYAKAGDIVEAFKIKPSKPKSKVEGIR